MGCTIRKQSPPPLTTDLKLCHLHRANLKESPGESPGKSPGESLKKPQHLPVCKLPAARRTQGPGKKSPQDMDYLLLQVSIKLETIERQRYIMQQRAKIE